jgi:hypothetical protein
MLKDTTRKGKCPKCRRPYVAVFQVHDEVKATAPMTTVDCPHHVECKGTFQLRMPRGAAEETLRLYTPSGWAAVRKIQTPKPLTAPEVALLQLQNDVTGLSTVDVRRLLADHERLRRLVEAEHKVPDRLRTDAGKGSTRGNAQRPLTEKELADFERVAITFRQALRATDEVKDPGQAVIESSFAMISMRLVAEVRRLRQLVVDAKPYVPDNEQTRAIDLPARLKAEVDRD